MKEKTVVYKLLQDLNEIDFINKLNYKERLKFYQSFQKAYKLEEKQINEACYYGISYIVPENLQFEESYQYLSYEYIKNKYDIYD